jgi:hypothetical protein
MVTNDQLDQHAKHIREFMEKPGPVVSGPPPSEWRRLPPEESPFSPSSKELRRLAPEAWFKAALDLFRATGGTLSLAFMPGNETEWQVGEAFAAYRLESLKANARVVVSEHPGYLIKTTV